MNFQGKQNPFSESFRSGLQSLADAASDYLENRSGYLRASHLAEPVIPKGFVAKITGASLVNGLDAGEFSGGVGTDTAKNVWKYKWSDFTTDGGTRSSNDYEFFALNGAEFGNTGTGSESFGVGVASGSPAIELLSIGNEGAVTPSVWMHVLNAPLEVTLDLYDSNDEAAGTVVVSTRYVFFAGNEVEVTC